MRFFLARHCHVSGVPPPGLLPDRNWNFESISLQRSVCELSVLIRTESQPRVDAFGTTEDAFWPVSVSRSRRLSRRGESNRSRGIKRGAMRPAFEMLVAPRGRDGAIPSVFQDGSLPASLLLHCCREVTPSAIMSASAPTNPDERYKREQCFRCPERARISWGRAMRGRGPGEGPSLSRSGQPHIDAPWSRKFNQGQYLRCRAATRGALSCH